jgi:hypothetical protein
MCFREKPAIVSRFIRRLHGGSQPALVETDDGELYVLKFLNNMQGPNLLFNESIGTELYRLAKLPAPHWRRLILTPAFIEQNPSCYLETDTGKCKPLPGMCFGSLFLGGAHRQVYELIPGTFYKRLTNIDDFWLAWLLDVCSNHADNREALFPVGVRGALHAVFIDHGHFFGGPNAEMHPGLAVSRYLDPRPYGPIDQIDAVRATKLKRSALNLAGDRLWRKAHNLPEEWKSPSALNQLSKCLGSLASPTIIEDTVGALLDLHRRAEETFTNCGSFSGKPPVSIGHSGIGPSRLSGLHVA